MGAGCRRGLDPHGFPTPPGAEAQEPSRPRSHIQQAAAIGGQHLLEQRVLCGELELPPVQVALLALDVCLSVHSRSPDHDTRRGIHHRDRHPTTERHRLFPLALRADALRGFLRCTPHARDISSTRGVESPADFRRQVSGFGFQEMPAIQLEDARRHQPPSP